MVQQWKTIRIFISSTFVDMHSERDHLSRDVYLRLKERCMKKHLHVQFVDLRWGISQEQAESGETIDILLDEIAKCDIFVSLLGERYGSTPDIVPERILQENWEREHSSSSFTALEILHKLHSTSSAKAFFYFRDSSFIAKISETEKQNYLPESPEAEQKLIALKKSIRNSGYKVMENYPCDFDGKQIVDLDKFGNKVLEDLWEAISELYPEEETEFDPISAEREMHDQFAHERSYLYVKRDKVEELDEYVQGDETKPFVITGEPGCGKSAFLANWYLENSESYGILAYFIGASSGSTDYRQLLRSMCEELKSRFSLKHDIPEGTEQLSDTLLSLLLEADRKCEKKIVLIIDALDQLEGNYGLGWLLNYRPINIKLILSSLEGPYLDELKRFEVPVLELPLLEKTEQKQIIRTVLDEFKGDRCELAEEQLDNLLEHPGTGTPLYLRIALEELRLFGDYAGLSDRIHSLGTDVSEMLEQVLERLENEHGKELVEKTFTLINCSRYGLSELELLELLKRAAEDKIPLLIWEKLRRSASFYLVQRGEYIGFFHKQLVEAVERRYPDKKRRHLELALYFENSELSRKVDEYPHQFMFAGDHENLKDALCVLELFNYAMENKKQYDLITYWNLIKDRYDQLKCYQEALNSSIENETVDVGRTLNNLSLHFINMDEYEKAEILSQHAFQIEEETFGKNHPRVATTLNNLSLILARMGEYQEAQQVCQISIEIRIKAVEINYQDVAQSLINYIGILQQIGEYEKAISLCQNVLEITEKAFGSNHPAVSMALNNYAGILMEKGEYDKALPLLERSLEIREKMLGKDHPDVAQSLINLALFFQQRGEYEKAMLLYKLALDIYEKVFGEDNSIFATMLARFVWFLQEMGEYDKAEPLCEYALKITEKVFGKDHPEVAGALIIRAELFQKKGQYEKALPLFERALRIDEKVLGSEHPGVAIVLNNLATLFEKMGEYEKVSPLYERALRIRKKTLGNNHNYVAATLANHAQFYHRMGNYEKALKLYQTALKIDEKALGKEHLEVAGILNNLAVLFQDLGKFEKGIILCQRALDIRERALGTYHPDVGDTLVNLGTLLEYTGDLEKAMESYMRAVDIYEKTLGKDHLKVSAPLNNLALILTHMSEYEKALPLYTHALKISENALGENHPDVARSIVNLGLVFTYMGEYEKALPLYERALEIYEKTLGLNHTAVATVLNNLGLLFTCTEDYEKALPLYERALEIREKAVGNDHPSVAGILNNLALFYQHAGNYEKAMELGKHALNIREKSLNNDYPDVAQSLNRLALLFHEKCEYEKALALHKRAYNIYVKVLGEKHPKTLATLENINLLSTRGKKL